MSFILPLFCYLLAYRLYFYTSLLTGLPIKTTLIFLMSFLYLQLFSLPLFDFYSNSLFEAKQPNQNTVFKNKKKIYPYIYFLMQSTFCVNFNWLTINLFQNQVQHFLLPFFSCLAAQSLQFNCSERFNNIVFTPKTH